MAEDWRKDADRRYKEKQKSGRFKLAVGDNSIRILPRKRKDGNFGGAPFIEYFNHPSVGPNERFFRCGKNLQGEGECWLCDVIIPKLKSSSDRSKRSRAMRMELREQFATQVAYLSDEGSWHGPTLWAVPSGGRKSMSAQLLGVLRSTKRDFVSLTKGYNLNIDRQGTGKTDTRYGAIIPDSDPTAVPKSIIDKMKTLAELIPAYNEDEQQAGYYGRDQDDEDARPKSVKNRTDSYDEDEEEESAPKKKNRDDDPEPDDDEEPAPKKKKGRVTEELDEDPEPDDDEEPAPKKKKGRVVEEEDVDKEFKDVYDDPEEDLPPTKAKAKNPGAATKSKKR